MIKKEAVLGMKSQFRSLLLLIDLISFWQSYKCWSLCLFLSFFFHSCFEIGSSARNISSCWWISVFQHKGFFVLYFAFLFYSARVAIINAVAIRYIVGRTKTKEQENQTVVYTHLHLRQRLPFHSTSKRKITKRNSWYMHFFSGSYPHSLMSFRG